MKKTLISMMTLAVVVVQANATEVSNTLSITQGDIENIATFGMAFDVTYDNVLIGGQFAKATDKSQELTSFGSGKAEGNREFTEKMEVSSFGLYSGYEFQLNEAFKLTPTIGYAWTSFDRKTKESISYNNLKVREKVIETNDHTYRGAAEIGIRLTLDNTVVIGVTHSFNEHVSKDTVFSLGIQF